MIGLNTADLRQVAREGKTTKCHYRHITQKYVLKNEGIKYATGSFSKREAGYSEVSQVICLTG
jgi:hypothetical protein